MPTVKKRNGLIVAYDLSKIEKAIISALAATDEVPASLISRKAAIVAKDVEVAVIEKHGSETFETSVEELQDLVEMALMDNGLKKTAKAYILYRNQHHNLREMELGKLDIKKQIDSFVGPVKDWRVKENSTVTDNLGGLILSNSGAVTSRYWLNEIYDEQISEAHQSAAIHIHDLSMLAPYCAGWSLKQLIQEGLGGVPGKISSAPARHLSTLCNQMVNFLGILQNEWAGRFVPAQNQVNP